MDVQMTSAPVAKTASTSSTSSTSSTTATTANKGTTKGNADKSSFSALLADQGAQGTTPSLEEQPADVALTMSMMLQMLQSLVMPTQTNIGQGTTSLAEDHALPELLLEAMSSNPALADKLLQDPNVKKWFENADDLLAALGNNSTVAGLSVIANLQQTSNVSLSLKAQNTLLTLSTMSKQQPENPILNYLTNDLTNTIQPLLPQVLAGLGKKREIDQSIEVMPTINLQSLQPKQEKFALKPIPISFNEQSMTSKDESTIPLVDLPIESNSSMNTIVTIGELQKTQQMTTTVEKVAAPVLTTANFTEEMTAHVLKNMKITMSEGFSEAKLSLFPKNLGHVDVKISMHDGQLFAQFAADTLAGKQMLESQLPQLRQALLTQGLQVEKLEVTQSSSMSSSMFQEQRQPQTFNQSQRQAKNRSNDIELDAIDINDDMEQLVKLRETANGNSFDVIA